MSVTDTSELFVLDVHPAECTVNPPNPANGVFSCTSPRPATAGTTLAVVACPQQLARPMGATVL